MSKTYRRIKSYDEMTEGIRRKGRRINAWIACRMFDMGAKP